MKLLMLITSLALLARSRAWVVFRWVGVAAPAQRCVWGITQRVAVVSPDPRRVGRGCPAMAHSPRHNGSDRGLRGLRGLSEMEALPSITWPSDARANLVVPLDGTRSLSRQLPRVTARPRCRRV